MYILLTTLTIICNVYYIEELFLQWPEKCSCFSLRKFIPGMKMQSNTLLFYIMWWQHEKSVCNHPGCIYCIQAVYIIQERIYSWCYICMKWYEWWNWWWWLCVLEELPFSMWIMSNAQVDLMPTNLLMPIPWMVHVKP